MVFTLRSMQGQKALRFHQTYLNLCSEVVVPDLDNFVVSCHFTNFSYFHTNKYVK